MTCQVYLSNQCQNPGRLYALNSERVSRKAEAKVNELKDQRIKKLEEKLIHKNEVIAELMEENVKAKKANGDL